MNKMELFKKVLSISGVDVLQIFGDSGSGKSVFIQEIVKDSLQPSIYIDTEKNTNWVVPKNCEHKYCPSFQEMYNTVLNLKDGYRLVALDSIGLPILGEFAFLGMRDRGDILLKCEAIAYKLKTYAHKNNALVLVANQPVSEFNKAEGEVRYPFGDKGIFFYKEVWKTEMLSSKPNRTECKIETFRSRKAGRGLMLFKIIINNEGISIEDSQEEKKGSV